jgi:hypothetical protein
MKQKRRPCNIYIKLSHENWSRNGAISGHQHQWLAVASEIGKRRRRLHSDRASRYLGLETHDGQHISGWVQDALPPTKCPFLRRFNLNKLDGATLTQADMPSRISTLSAVSLHSPGTKLPAIQLRIERSDVHKAMRDAITYGCDSI